jgi:ribosomal protein S18 acetylase RimI-like enzyme
MDGVQIREAELPADADALAEVYVSSAEHHAGLDPGFYRVPERSAVAARYRRASEELDAVILVAEVAGAVIGMASVQMAPVPTAASMVAPVPAAAVDVAVLPGHRGEGVGARLMAAAEQVARERGAARMVLDAAAANRRALRFYQEHLGYRPFGVLLAKPLTGTEDEPS